MPISIPSLLSRYDVSRQPTLFLDFDGVLHPDPVFMDNRTGKPVLSDEFGTLFEWVPILDHIMAEYPSVEIVLSTSWAAKLGFEEARRYLPASLGERIINCVWRKDEWLVHKVTQRRFEQMSRYLQIRQYVNRHKLSRWLALDDDDRDWPDSQRHRLVRTDDMTGLSIDTVQVDLLSKLDQLTNRLSSST